MVRRDIVNLRKQIGAMSNCDNLYVITVLNSFNYKFLPNQENALNLRCSSGIFWKPSRKMISTVGHKVVPHF